MIKNKIKNSVKTISIVITTVLFPRLYVKAALLDSTSSDCRKMGNCEVNDFVNMFSGIYELILGIVGSLTLLMVVIGGVMFLISGGSQERIARGKKIITSAFIGLAIVFASYIIITYVLEGIGM